MAEKITSTDKHAERYRVQLEFNDDGMKRLARLREELDARTNAELVRNALRLYEWYAAQKKENRKIHVINTDGTAKEVEFVF